MHVFWVTGEVGLFGLAELLWFQVFVGVGATEQFLDAFLVDVVGYDLLEGLEGQGERQAHVSLSDDGNGNFRDETHDPKMMYWKDSL